MTPEDDLKVGQWVAIHHDIPDDAAGQPEMPMFFGGYQPAKHSSVDGRPLKIIAISLPFLAVTDGEQRFPIDVRESKVIRLSPQYVKAMNLRAVRQSIQSASNSRYALCEPDKKAKDETPERACPLCRSRLIERLRDSRWLLACRQCGFEGGPPVSKQ